MFRAAGGCHNDSFDHRFLTEGRMIYTKVDDDWKPTPVVPDTAPFVKIGLATSVDDCIFCTSQTVYGSNSHQRPRFVIRRL